MKTILSLLLITTLMTSAYASQEQYLPLARFHIEANTGEQYGQIIVQGHRTTDGDIDSLSVKFLDLEVTVSTEITDQIPYFANGIQLSAERGYEITGGRTVYVTFSQGSVLSVPTCREKWVIAISEFDGAELLSGDDIC